LGEGVSDKLGNIIIGCPDVGDWFHIGMWLALLVGPRSMFRLNETDSFVSDLALENFSPIHQVSSHFVLVLRSRWIGYLWTFTIANTSMDVVGLVL